MPASEHAGAPLWLALNQGTDCSGGRACNGTRMQKQHLQFRLSKRSCTRLPHYLLSSFYPSTTRCQADDWRGRNVLFYFKCWMRPLWLAESKAVALASGWHSPGVSHLPTREAWKFSCLRKLVHWVGALDCHRPVPIKTWLTCRIICVYFDRVVF